MFEPERARAHLTQLLTWVGDGSLTPTVERHFALENFSEAMTFAISGKGRGKIIIDVVRI